MTNILFLFRQDTNEYQEEVDEKAQIDGIFFLNILISYFTK